MASSGLPHQAHFFKAFIVQTLGLPDVHRGSFSSVCSFPLFTLKSWRFLPNVPPVSGAADSCSVHENKLKFTWSWCKTYTGWVNQAGILSCFIDTELQQTSLTQQRNVELSGIWKDIHQAWWRPGNCLQITFFLFLKSLTLDNNICSKHFVVLTSINSRWAFPFTLERNYVDFWYAEYFSLTN